jgi:ABC-type multidrug transport system fused ATPase/permease subunit
VLNRRAQLAQKELNEKLDRIAARLEENHALAEATKAETESQSEIVRRLGELDVFQLRFDGTLRGFDQRLDAIRKEARAPLRQVTVILGFLSALAAVMSFVTLAVTLWGG